jgi:hypothetical protein
MNRAEADRLAATITECEQVLNGAKRCTRAEWRDTSDRFDRAWADLSAAGWSVRDGVAVESTGRVAATLRVVL